MKSFERPSSKARIFLLAAPLFAVTLAGCGSDGGNSTPPTAEARAKAISESPGVKAKYFPNGARLLTYVNDAYDEYAQVLQVCDGPDLLEQTAWNGKAGNSIERTDDYAACDDGKLTAGDFEIKKPLTDN